MNSANAIASTADFEFAALFEADNYRAAIMREFSPYLGVNVLEVGAGIGQFTSELAGQPSVSQVLAVEPESRFHASHAGRPWKLLKGTSRDVDRTGLWTSAVLVNVLEHIEDDTAELAWLHELLQPSGGHVCLLVPAGAELYAQLDRDFGHYRRYSRGLLRKRMMAAGFQVVSCEYFNSAGYFAWGLCMKIMGARNFSSLGVRFYDRLVFPWVNWLERNVVRPPFGQSLLAIGRAGKPDK